MYFSSFTQKDIIAVSRRIIILFIGYMIVSCCFTELVVVKYFTKLDGFLYWLLSILSLPLYLSFFFLIKRKVIFFIRYSIEFGTDYNRIVNYARLLCVFLCLLGMYFYWEIIGWPINAVIGFYGVSATIGFVLLGRMIIGSVKARLIRDKEYFEKSLGQR